MITPVLGEGVTVVSRCHLHCHVVWPRSGKTLSGTWRTGQAPPCRIKTAAADERRGAFGVAPVSFFGAGASAVSVTSRSAPHYDPMCGTTVHSCGVLCIWYLNSTWVGGREGRGSVPGAGDKLGGGGKGEWNGWAQPPEIRRRRAAALSRRSEPHALI